MCVGALRGRVARYKSNAVGHAANRRFADSGSVPCSYICAYMYGIYTVPGKRDLCPNESSYRVIRALRGWLLAEPRLRMRSRTRVDPVGNYREYRFGV